MTVALRVCGFLLMFFGVGLLFSPLIALIAWIPLVGGLVAAGVSFVVWIFAFLAATILTAAVVGLAWLYYRPLYGLLMLAIVGAGVAVLFMA